MGPGGPVSYAAHGAGEVSFLTPALLGLAALAAPIVVLYMLKLRRRETEVSSTLLWRMVLRDREANSPWQRLRRNLLLLLQLLLLALLVLALARPFVTVPVFASGQVTVLLDGSASMNATDVSPSRFDEARKVARALAADLAGDSLMTLILVTQQPAVLVSASNDKQELLAAIDGARPSVGIANWDAAFALAAGANGSVANSTTVLVSDGGLPAKAPPLTGEVRYVPVGSQSANMALSAFSLRPGPKGPQVFAGVTNYGDLPARTVLTINLDGQLFSAQQVSVAPGKTTNVILDGYAGVITAEAVLAPPAGVTGTDYLPTDDKAYAVYNPPQTGRVLLLSNKGNLFIEQLLAAFPGLKPFRAPADAPLPQDPFDVYVLDGAVTHPLPDKQLLIINPKPNELFNINGEFSPQKTSVISLATDDPLAKFVDLSNVHILKAVDVTLPGWARPLASLEGKPLIFYGTINRRRVVVFNFDLRDSDLPLQIAYPILMSNLMEWLTPATVISAAGAIHPGDSVTIRPAVGEEAVGILAPDNQFYTAGVANAGALFARTDLLGVYGVGTASQTSGSKFAGYFAVNLFDKQESAIKPAASLTIGRVQVAPSVRDQVGQREFWPYVTALALAILLVEWWAYHSGSRLAAWPDWRGWFRRKAAAR
jgi:Ca-activated chloride channel family protein